MIFHRCPYTYVVENGQTLASAEKTFALMVQEQQREREHVRLLMWMQPGTLIVREITTRN